MYEDMTYEYILKMALARVDSDIDKRQGSVIYDALAPCCMELSMLYIELDRVLNEVFADTASREYLIKRAKEIGLVPYGATSAVLKGKFNIEMADGARFNIDEVNYYISEGIAANNGYYYYKLVCESKGTIGNQLGEMTPIDTVVGLSTCTAEEIVVFGSDEEDTEEFRNRYFERIENQSFGGNVAQYKDWVMNIDGVGGVRVITATESQNPGEVQLIVQGEDYEGASTELIKDIKERLDPQESTTEGLGLAPIGHSVKVQSAETFDIDFYATITYESGAVISNVKNKLIAAIGEYLQGLNADWADVEKTRIRRSRVWYIISEVEGVENVENVKIENKGEDYTLGVSQIAGMGELYV